LHPNPEIRSFLRADNKSTTIVIAPKGFGKTLLLKAKRLSIQDKYGHILPTGALVEKPSGLPSVIPTTDYSDLRDSESHRPSCVAAVVPHRHSQGSGSRTGPLQPVAEGNAAERRSRLGLGGLRSHPVGAGEHLSPARQRLQRRAAAGLQASARVDGHLRRQYR